jgi:S-adenosylmethionine:tRNA ribosyltransferase-isomerase
MPLHLNTTCPKLVFNDTRVLAARLFGNKATGGNIEVLVERTDDYTALVHLRASNSPKAGATLFFVKGTISALMLERVGDLFKLRFSEPVRGVLAQHGQMPLPPYLGRDVEQTDSERYQTVYSDLAKQNSVAAPTAGLHFDEALLASLKEQAQILLMSPCTLGQGRFNLFAPLIFVTTKCTANG